QYRTRAGTASEDVDYNAASGTLTFAAGQTVGTIIVRTRSDTAVEPDEFLTLELFNPTNAILAGGGRLVSGIGVIEDDDSGDTRPRLFVADPVIVEGDAGTRSAVFEVRLSRPAATALTLDYATRDGSAQAGSDYQAVSGSTTFAAGQTTASVAVPVLGDTAVEGGESFSLAFTPTAAILNDASGAVGTATIVDDDGAPTAPEINIRDASVVEA